MDAAQHRAELPHFCGCREEGGKGAVSPEAGRGAQGSDATVVWWAQA